MYIVRKAKQARKDHQKGSLFYLFLKLIQGEGNGLFFLHEQNLPFYNNAKQDSLYFHFIVNEKTPALDIFN